MGQLEPASGVPVNQSEAVITQKVFRWFWTDLAADQGRRRIQQDGMVFFGQDIQENSGKSLKRARMASLPNNGRFPGAQINAVRGKV